MGVINVIAFDDVFTIENLCEAYYIVRRGKKYHDVAIRYHIHLHRNLARLLDRLKNGRYKLDRLSIFKVYEPKERDVIADFFEDKIVQDVICKKVLRPLLLPRFIHDNYASQPGKGTHFGIKRMQHFMLSYVNQNEFSDEGWIVAGDIQKFFYMIDHDICKSILSDLPMEKSIFDIICLQIDACTAVLNPYVEDTDDDVGLCIGFQCSQWLSNMYLNPLDHYVKEQLRVKYYGRYADDFVVICHTKEEAVNVLDKIKQFVWDKLHLKLNKKSYIHPFSQGICFLGYHMRYNCETHRIDMNIRQKSVARMERRTKALIHLIKEDKISNESAIGSLESWFSYAKHGETAKVVYAYLWARERIMDACNDRNYHKEVDKQYAGNDPMGLVDKDGFYMVIRRTRPYVDSSNYDKYAERNYDAMLAFFDRKKYSAAKKSFKHDDALDRIRKSI